MKFPKNIRFKGVNLVKKHNTVKQALVKLFFYQIIYIVHVTCVIKRHYKVR